MVSGKWKACFALSGDMPRVQHITDSLMNERQCFSVCVCPKWTPLCEKKLVLLTGLPWYFSIPISSYFLLDATEKEKENHLS